MSEDQQQNLESLVRRNVALESALREALHDLRTPLMTIQGFSQELAISVQELQALLPASGAKNDRMHTIVVNEIPEAIQYINEGANKLQSAIDRLSNML
jgi:signal transduction histidine kinase